MNKFISKIYFVIFCAIALVLFFRGVTVLLTKDSLDPRTVQRAINFGSRESVHYYLRGKFHLADEKLEAAEKDFQRAIELDPLNHVEYYLDLAYLYFKNENYNKAESVIASCLAKYPEEVVQHFKRQEKEFALRLNIEESEVDLGRVKKIAQLYKLKAIIAHVKP